MLAMLAALLAEREQLLLAPYTAVNCEDCGGAGVEWVSVDSEHVEAEVCKCRSLALDTLGDYKPTDAALERYWDGD